MSEMLTKLGIDWKLLIAQFVNFIILFLVLRAFAWKPLLKALEERRHKIKKGIDDAVLAEEKVNSIQVERDAILGRSRSEALRIVEDAKLKAASIKEEKMQSTYQEIEQQFTEAKEMIRNEKTASYNALKQDIAALVTQATGKIVKDLSHKDHEKMIAEAIHDAETA